MALLPLDERVVMGYAGLRGESPQVELGGTRLIGVGPEGFEDITLGQDPDEPVLVNDRQAPDAPLEHQEARADHFGVGVDRHDFRRHDVLGSRRPEPRRLPGKVLGKHGQECGVSEVSVGQDPDQPRLLVAHEEVSHLMSTHELGRGPHRGVRRHCHERPAHDVPYLHAVTVYRQATTVFCMSRLAFSSSGRRGRAS
jgi:hypothetical protein